MASKYFTIQLLRRADEAGVMEPLAEISQDQAIPKSLGEKMLAGIREGKIVDRVGQVLPRILLENRSLVQHQIQFAVEFDFLADPPDTQQALALFLKNPLNFMNKEFEYQIKCGGKLVYLDKPSFAAEEDPDDIFHLRDEKVHHRVRRNAG